MGNEDKGDAQATLQRFELALHLLAQLVVEGREGFIEQQQARLVDHGACNGDPLLLTAGELIRAAVGQLGELHHG